MIKNKSPYTILERFKLAEGIVGFRLAPSDGSHPPDFSPGSHIEVEVDGIGARHYSLTGDDPTLLEIAVALEADGRGGSADIHKHWYPGHKVWTGNPRNTFGADARRSAILIAGGIGITPIVSLRRSIMAAGGATKTHYAARNRRRFAFADALSDAPDHPVVFYSGDERRMDIARVINEAAENMDIYACGPATMLNEIEAAVSVRPDLALYSERFSAEAPSATGGGFEITIASDGSRLVVPEGRTILEVLRANGYNPDTSCEGGVCGTCRVAVKSGEIEHQDYFLSDAEKAAGDCIMICVSRARPGSNLVIDL